MNEKSLYRVGGLAAILSGIVTQLSGALHPVETETIFQPAVHMKEVAENASWQGVYVGFTLGFVLMLIGVAALTKSLKDNPFAPLARAVATATSAVAFVFFAIDGFATKVIALSVQGAGNTDAMIAAAGAVDRVGRAFFGYWTLLSWGVAPLLLGLVLLASRRWLGALPVVSGLLGVAAGLAQSFGDFSLGLLPLFYGAVALFNLFQIAMGVSLLRRSAQAQPAGQTLGERTAAAHA